MNTGIIGEVHGNPLHDLVHRPAKPVPAEPVILPLWNEYLSAWTQTRAAAGLTVTVAEVEAARMAFYAAMVGYHRALGRISRQYSNPKDAFEVVKREAETGAAR